jgi:hypothetical protein
MTKLSKRVIDAIGKHPLFWAYFQPEFGTRTVTAGMEGIECSARYAMNA